MAISSKHGVKRPKVVEESESSDSEDNQSEDDYEIEIKREEDDCLYSSNLEGDSFMAHPDNKDSMEIKEEDLDEVDIKEEVVEDWEAEGSAEETKTKETKRKGTKRVKFSEPEQESDNSDFSESDNEEDNFADADSAKEEGEDSKSVGSGLANVMTKIRGMKKSEDVIMSKAKTDKEVKKTMKLAKKDIFEFMDCSVQVKKEPMMETKEEEEEDRKPDISLHDREIHLACRMSYPRRSKAQQNSVVPLDPSLSDDDLSDEDDDQDPEFVPMSHDHNFPGPSDDFPAKRKCAAPLFEEEDLEEEEEEEEEEEANRKGRSKGTAKTKRKKKSALQLRPTTWKKADISNPPLPTYNHQPPTYVETPQQYFHRFFTPQLIKHITYQTNLYATQKDVATTFTTTEHEISNFVAILLYMGIVHCPSLDDYWAMGTRVPQVADIMSSKRFRLLRRTIHFNDNTQLHGTVDRFFKVRPLFTTITEACRKEPETPKQFIDEVIVGYKGKTAGNLRHYQQLKTDKWGFKLFARASEDGFVHDMILYQGSMELTLQAHGIPLSPVQKTLSDTSQVVTVLTSTMTSTCTTAIFADSYFTSLELVRYLRDRNCRYTGMAREARVGNPPLKSIQEMEKTPVPRGVYSYTTSDDGILAVRWKDNNIVTVVSTDKGVNPVTKCLRYSKETKKKEVVDCPSVIKSYNAKRGGIDESDMLVHLYKTPMKSKRWYMRLLAYCLDLSVCNAWLCYRRDYSSLGETRGLSLKDFRLQISKSLSSRRPALLHQWPRSSTDTSPGDSTSNFKLPRPIRGHRSPTPDASVRFDKTLFHAPLYQTRQTCKQCSKKGHIIRSNFVCRVCKIHLCLNGERNCFVKYHEAVA